MFSQNPGDLCIKIIKSKDDSNDVETFIIPQKDESFINLLGKTLEFDRSIQSVILALTNINTSYITKFDLPNLLTLIIAIRKHFPNFSVDSKIHQCINRYIDELFNQSFWIRLSNSVDCSFEKMDRRKFPYFNCVDEDWKSINTRAIQSENPYPAEMNGERRMEKAVTSTSVERRDGWKSIEQKAIDLIRNFEIKEEEIKIEDDGSIKNFSPDLAIKIHDKKDVNVEVHNAVTYRPKKDANAEKNAESIDSNYSAFDLLEPQFYPNLDEYYSFISLLYKAGLTNQVIKLLYILPLTYECCHIIKTEWFWKFWNDLIYDEQLKNFVIYYAMYILKHEEIKSYSAVPANARFAFDINEARLISENIPHIGIDKHPLIHLMEPLGYKSSYMPYFLDGERKINSLEVFKHRLSIATGGLLDNIDLSKYHACLSGSILVPCIATNPLEERFKHAKSSHLSYVINDLFDSILDGSFDANKINEAKAGDDAFKLFMNCYYPSYSSVPAEELVKFMEPVQDEEQYQAQKKEDLESPNRDYPNEIDHAIAYNVLSDLDISIHTDTFDEFKVMVYELFEVFRARALDLAAMSVTNKDGRIYIRRIRRVSNYKYSIYGPGIDRPIDLFWISKSPDTFVEQFHLGVVRSHWNGQTVRIMQSALAALLTGINHDYRWMSSNKAPAIPVLKYAQRGYTTPLNRFERPILIEYITARPEWTNSFKSQTAVIEQVYIPVSVNHIFFMCDITRSGIRYNLKPLDLDLTVVKKVNNERIKWNPISCSTNGIPLEYYNTSRNSVGVPTLDIIDKFLVKYQQ